MDNVKYGFFDPEGEFSEEKPIYANDDLKGDGDQYVYSSKDGFKIIGDKNIILKTETSGTIYYIEKPINNKIYRIRKKGKSDEAWISYQECKYGIYNSSEDAPNNDMINYEINKYQYIFGIDELHIGKSLVQTEACFISDDIEIGFLNPEEYVQLTANYNCGTSGSIEFYILDGSDPKPILPIQETVVDNEKIFFSLRTRFSINNDEKITVKENGITTKMTLDQAITSNKDGLTVSYTPMNAHSVKPANQYIRIKAIVRLYDITAEAPIIKSLAIKKIGGYATWESI